MKLIRPSYEILSNLDKMSVTDMLSAIELAGRTCYKSEDKMDWDSHLKFVKMIIEKGHESVLEHRSITVKFVIDRGVSHELVRHRIASFSQESTRYCNYSKDKFDNQITFIIPNWVDLEEGSYIMLEDNGVFDGPSGVITFNAISKEKLIYLAGLQEIEIRYKELLRLGWTAQQARAILPNSLKTEIIVTANLREWREIFRQRTSIAAHPQMREVMCPLLVELREKLPIIFDDITY